jgi:hypothetical protein
MAKTRATGEASAIPAAPALESILSSSCSKTYLQYALLLLARDVFCWGLSDAKP